MNKGIKQAMSVIYMESRKL